LEEAMLGAIAGDVIGSVHEGGPPGTKDFELFSPESTFTDDTVLTVAVAQAVREAAGFEQALRVWGRRYPNAGYGAWFRQWLFRSEPAPYNSFGNGAAMRVSPIGWAFDDLDDVLEQAEASAFVTHDHPEGIKGAQAVAAAVFVARTRRDKRAVIDLLEQRFGYDCSAPLSAWSDSGGVGPTCQETVPAAGAVFLRSRGYEDAVRNAVAIGGDADTLACIAGAITEAYEGGVPLEIEIETLTRLDAPLREELVAFARAYDVPIAADAP
jgi:ADP-ribosylglycohydrolase